CWSSGIQHSASFSCFRCYKIRGKCYRLRSNGSSLSRIPANWCADPRQMERYFRKEEDPVLKPGWYSCRLGNFCSRNVYPRNGSCCCKFPVAWCFYINCAAHLFIHIKGC